MLKSGIIVALLILAGRLTGFGREWLIAMRAGASEATDVAIVLLTFPDLMVGLILSGGLSVALIPAFNRLHQSLADALFWQAARLVTIVFALIALGFAIFAPYVLDLLAPGLPKPVVKEHALAFSYLTFALPIAALSGVAVARLQSLGRFALASSGTLVFNGVLIFFLINSHASDSIVDTVVVGVLAACLLRMVLQIYVLVRDGRFTKCHENLLNRQLANQFFGSFSFLSLTILFLPLARAMASLNDPGGLSLFNYAYKLVELPMGVVIGAVATVLLPRMAEDFVNSGAAAAKASLVAGIRTSLWATVGILVPMVFFGDAVVQVAFFKAAFTTEQISILAGMASVGFCFLPAQGVLNIYGIAFAAVGHVRPLFFCAVGMLVMMLVVTYFGNKFMGLKGVMLAYGSVSFAGVVGLSCVLRDSFGPGVWSSIIENSIRSILLPSIIAAATAICVDFIGEGVSERILCACITLFMYLVSTFLLNEGLRKNLSSLVDRDSK